MSLNKSGSTEQLSNKFIRPAWKGSVWMTYPFEQVGRGSSAAVGEGFLQQGLPVRVLLPHTYQQPKFKGQSNHACDIQPK